MGRKNISRTKSRSKSRPCRNASAYNCFVKKNFDHYKILEKNGNKTNFGATMKALGKAWKELDDENKKEYVNMCVCNKLFQNFGGARNKGSSHYIIQVFGIIFALFTFNMVQFGYNPLLNANGFNDAINQIFPDAEQKNGFFKQVQNFSVLESKFTNLLNNQNIERLLQVTDANQSQQDDIRTLKNDINTLISSVNGIDQGIIQQACSTQRHSVEYFRHLCDEWDHITDKISKGVPVINDNGTKMRFRLSNIVGSLGEKDPSTGFKQLKDFVEEVKRVRNDYKHIKDSEWRIMSMSDVFKGVIEQGITITTFTETAVELILFIVGLVTPTMAMTALIVSLINWCLKRKKTVDESKGNVPGGYLVVGNVDNNSYASNNTNNTFKASVDNNSDAGVDENTLNEYTLNAILFMCTQMLKQYNVVGKIMKSIAERREDKELPYYRYPPDTRYISHQ